MLIGVIECGTVDEPLASRHGDYPDIFARLLGRVEPGLRFRTYRAVAGEVPEDPAACDGWLLTGSKHGVYDDLAWIAPLETFLRAARGAGRSIIGVCFGHQLLAEALGGRAVKSERGWGVGVHEYEVVRRPGWMGNAPARVALHAMHQDQVVEVPADATVLATSPFCPYAALAYGDPEAPDAISVQPHPEYDAAFARGVLELRSGASLDPKQVAAALETVDQPVDGAEMARWFVRYLEGAAARRQAA